MPLPCSVYARRSRWEGEKESEERRAGWQGEEEREERLTANTNSLYILKWTPCNPPLYTATAGSPGILRERIALA